MFSTAMVRLYSFSRSATPSTNARAYSRCHRNGGWTTTTSAPTSRAISALRCSLPHGSVPHTRWVSRRHGACTETIGISWNSLSDMTASMSLLTSSMLTITSTPS
jgi:hypothetical protein